MRSLYYDRSASHLFPENDNRADSVRPIARAPLLRPNVAVRGRCHAGRVGIGANGGMVDLRRRAVARPDLTRSRCDGCGRAPAVRRFAAILAVRGVADIGPFVSLSRQRGQDHLSGGADSAGRCLCIVGPARNPAPGCTAPHPDARLAADRASVNVGCA